MKSLGIIFSNIYDSTLGELTNHRTVASLPFGGRYRQVDFALSNMSNSGIHNVGIITKHNYRSLMDHLGNLGAWDLNRKNEGVMFLPPFADGNMASVYKGKLEALYSAVHFIDNPIYGCVVICDSTVLCNIDYREVIKQHVATESDVTVVVSPKNSDMACPLAIRADAKGCVKDVRVNTRASDGELMGMGMFVVTRALLVDIVRDAYSRGYTHFERDFIQRGFNNKAIKIGAYCFRGVVLRNSDIVSYYKNNLALLDKDIRDGLFLKDAPIYTKVRDEAPTYYAEGSGARGCMIADGCIIRGEACNSIIFRDVSIERGASVKNSIIMQGCRIASGAMLECVILDKNVTVSEGACLRGTVEHPIIVKKGETV